MIKQKIEYRRGLSLLLTLLMCLSMVNLSVFAQEGDRPTYCGKEAHTHSIEAGCYERTCEKNEGDGAVEGQPCNHTQHDEDCGYVEAVEGHDCKHAEGVHDDSCGYVEAKAEVPCDKGCDDTDGDGKIDHAEGCAYQPAVEGHDCNHVHDTEVCGYVEAVEGHACKHENGEHDATCGYVEAVEGHHHTNDCYDTTTTICEFTEEHTHSEACYFEAAFDFETGTLTINGTGELTKEIVDSFEFESSAPIEGFAGESSMGSFTRWKLNVPWVNSYKAGLLNGMIKKVVIGDGITAIGERALGGTGYANANYTGSGSRSLVYAEELVLPEGLLTIGKSAFAMMGQSAASDLFTVNFPSSLMRIEELAFSMCMKLPENLTLTVPNAVIEGSAFHYCESIKELTIDGAKELEPFAFEGCKNLTTVELKKIMTVGDGQIPVFGSINPKLETLILTEVGEVKPYAFKGYYYEWSNLKNLTVNGSDTVKTKIDEYAFYYNYNLVNVTMNNVESIGKLAFYGAGWLDTVTLTNIGTIGEQAFYGYKENTGWSQLKNVTIDGCETIGKQAFANCYYVTSLDLDNIGIIGQDSFYYNGLLETVTMGKVGTISQYAFRNCEKLTAIDSLKNVDRIDGFAFYGCANLSGLTVEDLTKMGFNGNYGDVMDRVQRILAGEFKLDAAPDIADITVGIPEEGWEDGKTAQSDNWKTYKNGTQLVEQARWTNPDKTEAEVKVDAYYTAPKQMDYIFVADLSASMAQLGNPEDMNSRFYDMQSKLLDMTDELLNAGEVYDCRVAIVTFGGALDANTPGTSTVMKNENGEEGFARDKDVVKAHIDSLEPLFENTDYGLGMQKALKLAQDNANAKRNTVVIFLSDGAPNQNGSGDKTGTTAAAAIKALDNPDGTKVPIYGVLHSAPADLNNGDPRYQYHTNAMNAMKAVCSAPTEDVPVTVFEATNTKSFGEAMNDAFTAVYPDYTVTVPVNEAFENVREWKVSVSGGEADYDAENHAMIWTITGMPFTKHTLTYSMSLTAENAAKYGEQSYPVNTGNAVIAGGASVETPVLTRTVAEPVVPDPGPDPVTRYTLTINYVYEDGTTAAPTHSSRHDSGYRYSVSSPGIEGYTPDQAVVSGTLTSNVTVTVVYTADANIDDENPPLAENPDENPGLDIEDENPPLSENPEVDIPDENPPLAENPEVDIPDEDVPLDATPKTGDDSHTGLWAGLCVVSLLGAVALGRKEEDERA